MAKSKPIAKAKPSAPRPKISVPKPYTDPKPMKMSQLITKVRKK